ncbi:hypothetical protein C8R45DRAFT_1113239 [Mycena sanguinolenta]|nr:hypothetical protein C8R45DRAFT_1113239 [Mycena sanguinolenta]
MLRDYQTRKPVLLLQKLAHIHETGSTDSCVIMEYLSGRCIPRVVEHPLEGQIWMERSATGFREMHVVRFVGVDDPLEIRCLLRCNSSAQVDGLVELARLIPEGTDVAQLKELHPALFMEFQKLVNLEVVEIYCEDSQ